VIVGFLRDKHPGPFLAALDPAVSHLIATSPASARALPAAELFPIAREANSQASLSLSLETSLHIARAAAQPDAPIVVTGSLTLVAEARVLLGIARSDPTPSLDIPENLRSIPIG
jgi:dihydrofolate synthase/folylpolyglutamate synthase